jgi:hypothetical protein
MVEMHGAYVASIDALAQCAQHRPSVIFAERVRFALEEAPDGMRELLEPSGPTADDLDLDT